LFFDILFGFFLFSTPAKYYWLHNPLLFEIILFKSFNSSEVVIEEIKLNYVLFKGFNSVSNLSRIS